MSTRKRILRAVLLALGIYIFLGLLFKAGGLYCYNVRHWDVYGGFSLPPLFFIGFFLDLLLWPLFLWANLINHLGPFGICRPL